MKWHTEVRKISELKNWESNPRTITEEAYKELKESINNLGNFEPLVINTDGVVLAGNQRLRVALEKGDKEIEVSVPERELTEDEIKKIGIISNRHSGEWDMDKLANEFEDTLEELGFSDLMPTSFEDKNKEIDINEFGDKGLLIFRLSQEDYMLALQLLANAVEKTESDTNEECIMKLLQQYE